MFGEKDFQVRNKYEVTYVGIGIYLYCLFFWVYQSYRIRICFNDVEEDLKILVLKVGMLKRFGVDFIVKERERDIKIGNFIGLGNCLGGVGSRKI